MVITFHVNILIGVYFIFFVSIVWMMMSERKTIRQPALIIVWEKTIFSKDHWFESNLTQHTIKALKGGDAMNRC